MNELQPRQVRFGALGHDHAVVAQAQALLQPGVHLAHGPDVPGEPHLADGRGVGRHGLVVAGRGHAQHGGQIRAPVLKPKAPRHGKIGVLVRQSKARPPFQNGQQHVEPGHVHAHGGPPGGPVHRRAQKGLDLRQQGPGPLQHAAHGTARRRPGGAQKQTAGVRHGGHAPIRHLKDPQLVGGAEPVLLRPQEPKPLLPIPFKIQHRVHDVFQHLGPGQSPLLGHVAHQEHRRARLLGEAGELGRRAPDLGHAARGGRSVLGEHGLDGIDDEKGGLAALGFGKDGFHRILA